MKKQSFLIVLIILCTQFLNSTVYENADDIRANWSVYSGDNGIVSVVADAEQGNNVIELSGPDGLADGFQIDDNWNQSDKHILSWKMKYSENFTFYVKVNTKNSGTKYIVYQPSDDYSGVSDLGSIRVGLGESVKDGTWQTFTRDIEADIQLYNSGYELDYIIRILVRGSGRLDDIVLSLIDESDTTAPVITLNGDANITLTQGAEYIELNATAIDNVDGNVSVVISGDVNTSAVGLYSVTYTATDSSNNEANSTRIVNVIANQNEHYIPELSQNDKEAYLTAINNARSMEQDCGVNGIFSATEALNWSDKLYKASYEHSQDMAINNSLSHMGSGTESDWSGFALDKQSSPIDRIENYNYVGTAFGENISIGGATVEETVNQLLNSDIHCMGIMNDEFNQVGMAMVEDVNNQYYWTQDFGKGTIDNIPPIITLNGNSSITIVQDENYNELGATAFDTVDGNLNVTIIGEVDTSTLGTYTITYSSTDNSENVGTSTREILVVEFESPFGVKISDVQGHTVSRYDMARFRVSLKTQPESNVTIPISSSDENEGKIQPINGDNTKLLFSHDNWNTPQMVYVKGQKENPVGTVQNYKIILDAIISDDVNYDGLNPNNVDMKGLELTLNEPTDIKFIANLPKTVNIETAYNGTRRLTYTLLEHPDGMTISPNSSWISWTAPESAEGNSYPVKIKVENREFSSEISFSVNVANTTTIQTEINGTKIIVTEEGNLKGLVITALDNNINLSDIKLSKTLQNDLLEVPNYVTKISDFFVFNELISGKVRIKLPLSQLPVGVNLNYVSLYCLGTAQGINEEFWGPSGVDEKIIYEQGKPFLQLELYELEGASFIGFEIPEFPNKNAPLIPFQKKSSTKFSKINISDINCTPTDNNGSLNYMIQNCRVNNSNIKVENFGISSNSIRWGVAIEELITWLVDARDGFDKLNLDYDNNFTVNIHGMRDKSTLGYVRKKDNYKILYLTSIDYISKAMQTTSIHEYFHHSQSRSKINGRDLLLNGSLEKKWFTEGSAVWFTDYDTLDSLNGYPLFEVEGDKILEAGLNSRPRNGIYREYQRFSFLKLASSKCSNFDNVFREMLNINRNVDPSGIKNFTNELGNADCDFGDQLGEDKKSSLESALLYYQYSTIQEDNIKLLDSNEDRTTFDFDGTWSAYKRDWSDLLLMNFILDKIPAYGANSFKVDFDDLKKMDKEEIMLTIMTDKPITMVGIRLDENGKSTAIGAENNFHFTTESGKLLRYILTDEDREGGLFITLLNATGEEVKIEKLEIVEGDIREIKKEDWNQIVEIEDEIDVNDLENYSIDSKLLTLYVEKTDELLTEARCRERYISFKSDDFINVDFSYPNYSSKDIQLISKDDSIWSNYYWDTNIEEYISHEMVITITDYNPYVNQNEKNIKLGYGIRRTNILSIVGGVDYCANILETLSNEDDILFGGNIAQQFRNEEEVSLYIDRIKITNNQSGQEYAVIVEDDGTWSKTITLDRTVDSLISVQGYNSSDLNTSIKTSNVRIVAQNNNNANKLSRINYTSNEENQDIPSFNRKEVKK